MHTEIINGVTIIHTGNHGKKEPQGVSYIKSKRAYHVRIEKNSNSFSLGYFEDKEIATKARKLAEIKLEDGTIDNLLNDKPNRKNPAFSEWWNDRFSEYGI